MKILITGGADYIGPYIIIRSAYEWEQKKPY